MIGMDVQTWINCINEDKVQTNSCNDITKKLIHVHILNNDGWLVD